LEDLFFKTIVDQNPELLETKLSHYERQHRALYVKSSLMQTANSTLPNTAILAHGELGHVHTDLSMHLYFTEAAARRIMERGWGERHRLTKKFLIPSMRGDKYWHPVGIDQTYLLLYGPRDAAEFEVTKKLLKASAYFMTGYRNVGLA
jgi:hypothetical protein